MADSLWYNCYDGNWRGGIVSDAFAHPAKFSRALIRRIYEHALQQGWLAPGMTVVDPFGGVALGALDALWNGLHYIGVELESRFVTLGEQNIALWQYKYRDKVGLGSARLLQGDSRQLSEIIGSADLVCSSPPYADVDRSGKRHNAIRNMQEKLSRGELTGRESIRIAKKGAWNPRTESALDDYGTSPGQLGRMKVGVPPQVACVVGSPPYATDQMGGGGLKHDKVIDAMKAGYGETEGQLSAMPEGRFDADMIVSSPPFEGSLAGEPRSDNSVLGQMQRGENKTAGGAFGKSLSQIYGGGDGNIGNQSGDTFWSAAREIVAQCHAILKPGGHAIWVCKDFVRKGKRVPFSDQWQALCESAGFHLVCRHRAMLVKYSSKQRTIFGEGEIEQIVTERKSFFRRLAEKKGSPKIDFEDVICLGVADDR